LALKNAAQAGFADLDAGHFDEAPGARLDDYIANLGREAVARLRKAGA